MPARSLLLLVPFIIVSQIGKGASSPQRAPFGTMPDGKPVEQFTLTNARGLEVKAISYGGIITSLRVPDRNGRLDDVVLGFDTLEGYLKNDPFLGAIIGRYGNRIGKAQFALDGKTYKLAANNGPNHLHGGIKGFDKVLWTAEPVSGANAIAFTRTSADGEEGYPGNLRVRVIYTLTDANELAVEYRASTRQADAGQPDAAQLLQSRRSGLRRHPRSSTDAECRPVHTGRRRTDPNRRTCAGYRTRRSTFVNRRQSAHESTTIIRS